MVGNLIWRLILETRIRAIARCRAQSTTSTSNSRCRSRTRRATKGRGSPNTAAWRSSTAPSTAASLWIRRSPWPEPPNSSRSKFRMASRTWVATTTSGLSKCKGITTSSNFIRAKRRLIQDKLAILRHLINWDLSTKLPWLIASNIENRELRSTETWPEPTFRSEELVRLLGQLQQYQPTPHIWKIRNRLNFINSSSRKKYQEQSIKRRPRLVSRPKTYSTNKTLVAITSGLKWFTKYLKRCKLVKTNLKSWTLRRNCRVFIVAELSHKTRLRPSNRSRSSISVKTRIICYRLRK